MQRSNLARRAQALLPCDDDDDAKNKHNALCIQTPQVWLRTAKLAVLLFGATFVFFYLNSGFNASLNDQVTALQAENKGLLNDQVTALQAENKRLRMRLESVQQQSNVRRGEDKPVAVTPIRSSIPAKVLAPVTISAATPAAAAAAAVAAPVATTTKTNKAAVASSALEPLACQEFLDKVKAGTYRDRVKDPNLKQGRFTRRTITEHPFWISVHHEMFDKTRWTIFKKGRYYEHSLAKIWTTILREASPGSRVLDVGYVTLLFTMFHHLCCCGVVQPPASHPCSQATN
jgi:hypothetical protein